MWSVRQPELSDVCFPIRAQAHFFALKYEYGFTTKTILFSSFFRGLLLKYILFCPGPASEAFCCHRWGFTFFYMPCKDLFCRWFWLDCNELKLVPERMLLCGLRKTAPPHSILVVKGQKTISTATHGVSWFDWVSKTVTGFCLLIWLGAPQCSSRFCVCELHFAWWSLAKNVSHLGTRGLSSEREAFAFCQWVAPIFQLRMCIKLSSWREASDELSCFLEQSNWRGQAPQIRQQEWPWLVCWFSVVDLGRCPLLNLKWKRDYFFSPKQVYLWGGVHLGPHDFTFVYGLVFLPKTLWILSHLSPLVSSTLWMLWVLTCLPLVSQLSPSTLWMLWVPWSAVSQ